MNITLEFLAVMIAALAVVIPLLGIGFSKVWSNGANKTTIKGIQDAIKSLPCKKDENYYIDKAEMKSDIKAIKATLSTLPCSERKEEIKETTRKLNSMDASLNSINHTLVVIQRWIMKTDIEMIDSFSAQPLSSQKNSPRVLNELGFQILEIVGGTKFLQENKDFFFELMEKEEPKTALDVESIAYRVCFISTDEDIFNTLKNRIYNASAIDAKDRNGNDAKFVIDLSNTCHVLSLPLRDMYLEKYPELLKVGEE